MTTLSRSISPAMTLPASSTSFDGVAFFPSADVWKLNDRTRASASIDWRRVGNCLSEELLFGVKSTMRWYAETRSLSHVRNIMACFNLFIEGLAPSTALRSITSAHLMSYRSTLLPQHEWKLAVVSGFL